MYELALGEFRTPRGHPASMWIRGGTSDWNTCYSALNEDEYQLKTEVFLVGAQALDVGAHIGSVTVGLLLDNPELRVVAIEAVPPNVELLGRNLVENRVSDRATVIHAAAGKGSKRTVKWGFGGDENARHHAFIGNALLVRQPKKHESETLPGLTLSKLVKDYGPFDFCKIDCEGCEFDFLEGSALSSVALIRGEVHSDSAPLANALTKTHTVSMPDAYPGQFEAVRR